MYESVYKTTITKSANFLLNKQVIQLKSEGRILNCSFDDAILTSSYLVVDKYFVLGGGKDPLKVNQCNLKGAVNYMLTPDVLFNISFKQISANGEDIFEFFQDFGAPNKNLRLKNVSTAKFLMPSVNIRNINQININNLRIMTSKWEKVSRQNNPHFLIYLAWTKPTNIIPLYSYINKYKSNK